MSFSVQLSLLEINIPKIKNTLCWNVICKQSFSPNLCTPTGTERQPERNKWLHGYRSNHILITEAPGLLRYLIRFNVDYILIDFGKREIYCHRLGKARRNIQNICRRFCLLFLTQTIKSWMWASLSGVCWLSQVQAPVFGDVPGAATANELMCWTLREPVEHNGKTASGRRCFQLKGWARSMMCSGSKRLMTLRETTFLWNPYAAAENTPALMDPNYWDSSDYVFRIKQNYSNNLDYYSDAWCWEMLTHMLLWCSRFLINTWLFSAFLSSILPVTCKHPAALHLQQAVKRTPMCVSVMSSLLHQQLLIMANNMKLTFSKRGWWKTLCKVCYEPILKVGSHRPRMLDKQYIFQNVKDV